MKVKEDQPKVHFYGRRQAELHYSVQRFMRSLVCLYLLSSLTIQAVYPTVSFCAEE